nr:hypothetical protein [Tanacetum cinerariifolium]
MNSGNGSRDARNDGYKGRDNGKRPAREEDEKALVVQDGLGYDSQFNEKELLDVREEEVTKTMFDNRSSDEENSLANDRFKKGEGYHAFPPPLTGNYMPPKSDISFARLDDSIYKFNINEIVTSLTKDEKDALETSTAFVKKTKEIDFVKAGESVKPIKSVKNVKPVKPVKTAEQIKKSKTFSSIPTFDRKDWENDPKTGVRMAEKSVLPNNVGKGTGHKESRPVWNNVQRINHQNKFAPTAVFTRSGRIPVSVANLKAATSTSAAKPINTAGPKQSGHPQQALKNKGIVDSGCSRHMTGNKAYLADYQEINDGGFVAFGSSRASIDESNLWHRRLGHIKFKTMNKLVKGNLAEAVNTACYVLNRALVTKSHNKTPYELLNGRTPRLDFIRPFGCPVTILNTLYPLGKVEGKAYEGFLVGYSVTSKAFKVFNTKTRKVKENLHVRFLKNKPNVGRTGPNWLFDIDSLTNSMNYIPVSIGNQTDKNAGPQDTNGNASTQDNVDARKEVSDQYYIVLPFWSSISSIFTSSDDKAADVKPKDDTSSKTVEEPVNKEDQAYIDELDRLMSQDKEASDEADALRKEFE